MIKLRNDGVEIPKREWKHHAMYQGDLKIIDTLEGGYNRVLKKAQFTTTVIAYTSELLDVEMVWMNGNKFTLKGFERVPSERGLIDYAQSWLITVDFEQSDADRTK